MSRKTNKTARVLGLLARGGAEDETVGTHDKQEYIADIETNRQDAAKPSDETAVTSDFRQDEPACGAGRSVSDVIRDELIKLLDGEINDVAEKMGPSEKENMRAYAEKLPQEAVYTVKNIMEQFVISKALEIIEKTGGCTCDKCLNDVIALSLNGLPPKYVVTKKGEFYAKLDQYRAQNMTDIISAITKASLQVKKVPMH